MTGLLGLLKDYQPQEQQPQPKPWGRALMGIGHGLTALSQGQTPNLAPYAQMGQQQKKSDPVAELLSDPTRRKALQSMPPQMAERILMQTMFGVDMPQQEQAKGVNVGGRLVNPVTGEVIFEPPQEAAQPDMRWIDDIGMVDMNNPPPELAHGQYQPQADPGFRIATPEEAAQYGATAGQFGPDGRFHPINPPSGTSLQVGPDGTLQFNQGAGVTQQEGGVPTNPGKFAMENSKNDAEMLKTARDQAAAADALSFGLETSQDIVDDGFNSGMDAPLRKWGSRVGAAIGVGEGGYAAQHEQFESVSKEIGMDQLKAIGGNDTERELLTAIQTTASPDKEEPANKAILKRKKAAVSIITQKPGLMQEWISKYGSLSNPNQDGVSWDNFWRAYQLESFRQMTADDPQAGGSGAGDWPALSNGQPDWANMNDAQMESYFKAKNNGQ